jgi:hypothetical protein
MYLLDDSIADGIGACFNGFSEASEQDVFQKSRTAIDAALRLNPVGGYVVGSAARLAIESAFASVPQCLAVELEKELTLSQTPLAKLFRHRLADETQRRLLEILKKKANDCLDQQRKERGQIAEELRKKEEEFRARQQVLKTLCSNMKSTQQLIDKVCSVLGEDSVECKKQRANALRAAEENRRAGVNCD